MPTLFLSTDLNKKKRQKKKMWKKVEIQVETCFCGIQTTNSLFVDFI